MHRRLLRAIDEFPARLLAVVLVVLAVVSIGYVWWSVDRFEDFVHCQAEWSEELLDYQTANDQAAARERSLAQAENRALNRLVRDLLGEDVEDQVAIDDWRAAQRDIAQSRETLQNDREQNPLPEPPLEVCNGGSINTTEEGAP